MARGTANNEPIVSQARTPEFDAGYERIFGDRKPERGRWVYDEAQRKLVRVEDYVPPSRALDAPFMVDRFYEGIATLEGEDIGSRRKHREYMRRNGLTSMSDYSPEYYERMRKERAEGARKRLAEAIDRKFEEIQNRRG
jgi:hypothetical protein